MFAQRSTISRVAAAATLAMCLALPGVIWAKTGPPENTLSHPIHEILPYIDILNKRMAAASEPGGIGRCGGSKMGGQKISGADRFVPVLYGVAYCDRETGIVWETSPAVSFFNWPGAISHCTTREVGGRKGWALPMREQLASLLEINSVLCLGGGTLFAGCSSVSKRAVGQLLVGVDNRGHSHLRLARELFPGRCVRHQVGGQRSRVVCARWTKLRRPRARRNCGTPPWMKYFASCGN